MSVRILTGDCRDVLATLPDESVHCVVTSPPYFGLRDYGHAGQIGLEPTPDAYVAEMMAVFREVRRVLRKDGTCWLNLGDSYNAHPGQRKTTDKAGAKQQSNTGSPGAPSRHVDTCKPKDLIGIPWMVAFALRADGWYLRQDIIWAKPNPMPESVRDRPTKAHEYLFLLAKSSSYWYDADAIKEPAIYSGLANQDDSGFKDPRSFNGKHKDGYRSADKQRGHGRRHAGFNDRWDAMERAEQCSGLRNRRSVWTVATQPFSEAHFATFPPDLIEPCIKAGCPTGGTVLDPFGGAGTTGLVADRLQRNAILIELNPEYAAMADKRIYGDCPMFSTLEAAE
jgi:DNA modification methylase